MKDVYQDREISTLSFNERVLQEAEDPRNPLLERLRFLGIFSSNMDEFFKVRVASTHRMIELGSKSKERVLEVIGARSHELDRRFQAAYAATTAELAREGVSILTERDVESGTDLADWLRVYFREQVLPSLVPLIIDERQEFPQLIDGQLYFAVKMRGDAPRYAILPIPSELGRFVELPNGHIMYLDDVIRYALNDVFYIFDYDEIEAFEFKILRDAELDMDNDFSEDYVRRMEEELHSRKGGRPTRMAYDAAIPPVLLRLLIMELRIGEDYPLIGGARYHNMKDLRVVPVHRPELSFEPWPAAAHPVLDASRTSMLALIQQQDILVTYPYQSFDHVLRVLREAAIDPKVEAIKMALYRVADGSQVVNALVNAAQNGKSVFVSIELQARFDERRNIAFSERLQEAGVTVVYGVPPMKVHSKLLLVQREGEQFAGLSTGNFNEATAKSYVDSTLFTADPRLTAEVNDVFEYLERASRMRLLQSPKFQHLLVSPFNLRRTITRLLDAELKKGAEGYVLLKVNHLTDGKLIRKLRAAADAGVEIEIIARTTYAMQPHAAIRATSIVDRYLEHQRAFIFGRGADRRVYLASSDLMERNLDWRVEVAFPIYDAALQEEVCGLMAFQAADEFKARVLDEAQSNPYAGEQRGRHHAQRETYEYFVERSEEADAAAGTIVPFRAGGSTASG